MYTSGKKRIGFFCENHVKRENRILKSGIQPLMESGIHESGIRNPQTWNPKFKTLLDYLTWGELTFETSAFKLFTVANLHHPLS